MQQNNIKNKNNKYIQNRKATPEEIIYIFKCVIEGWKVIKIYNTMIQKKPSTKLTKKIVENISTGNVKIHQFELEKEEYEKYINLRQQVYDYHLQNKKNKNVN